MSDDLSSGAAVAPPGPTWLFCPGDRPDRYPKALAAADLVIIDLEDAVSDGDKPAARRALVSEELDPARVIVRINPANTAAHDADLEALRRTAYRTVMLAKTERVADLAQLSAWNVVALIETPAGVVSAPTLAAADGVSGLMWGAEDLTAAMGGRSSRHQGGQYRDFARYARSSVLLAAHAAGRFAVDTVYIDIADSDGLAAEAQDAAASGFSYKACIHPSQVPIVRDAFRPPDEMLAWARRVLAAPRSAGVVTVDGQMIDAPLLRQAQRVLAVEGEEGGSSVESAVLGGEPQQQAVGQSLAHEVQLLVTNKQMIADGVVTLDLVAVDGSRLPSWRPGAHVDLQCGAQVRQYSLCGDPTDDMRYRVAVRHDPAGRGGSTWVHDVLATGACVTAWGPRNHFEMVGAASYVFVAGGIGITPLLPMALAADRVGAPWSLHYGGRNAASMPFVAELVKRFGDRVHIYPQDEVGLLDLERIVGRPEAGSAVYVCGPEPLLQAAERSAASWAASLHVERFAPKDQVVGPNSALEVQVASTGQIIAVPADTSILSALNNAGCNVLFSCTEGTCGTCETGVLEGEVDHRDSLLTDAEQQANDVMMVCVSRARTSRLVLDL